MSARTQITMDLEMQRRAHAKAAELGISFAEYVRRLVADDLGERMPKADISMVFDLGASAGPTNVARDKRAMIGEAAWDDHVRSVQVSRRSFGDANTRVVPGDFPDQDVSIVDRTNIAVMERLGITRVASFDHHFAIYRYGPKRDRAFQIVR